MKEYLKRTVIVMSVIMFPFVANASAGGLFTDISPTAWYYNAVKEVSNQGIMKGYEDGNFHPNDYITRAEVAQVISNTVKVVKHDDVDDRTVSVVAKALPSTVRIDTADNRYGAGFFVADNLVLTNWHVAQYGSIRIWLFGGQTLDGVVVKKDEANDLALIKVDLQGLTIQPLQFATGVSVGESVVAIGTPQGMSFNVTKGVISATNYGRFMVFDAPINPGNSGGALIDMNGNIVGIPSNKNTIDGYEGLGFAIKYDVAKKFVQ